MSLPCVTYHLSSSRHIMDTNETVSLHYRPCLSTMRVLPWNFACVLCRLGGACIFVFSIVCLKFNIRFLSRQQQRPNLLILSLFLASVLVVTFSVPGMLVQLITCHRHCLAIYCRLEGFVSYFSGCLCMLALMMLSVHRYLGLHSYRGFLSVRVSALFCWTASLIFTFPLIFDCLNSYLPEGLGFHCSINWKDRSSPRRLYIFMAFLMMYFLPLLVLVVFSFRVHAVIRNVHAKHYLIHPYLSISQQTSSSPTSRRLNFAEQTHDSNYYVRHVIKQKRQRMDYRFFRAILFIIGNYLLAWTPYSVVAVLQLLNIQWIFSHAFLMTLSAFLAKSSVISAPFVYLRVMNSALFRRILFQ